MRYITWLPWLVSMGLILQSLSDGSVLAFCLGLMGIVGTGMVSTLRAAWSTSSETGITTA